MGKIAPHLMVIVIGPLKVDNFRRKNLILLRNLPICQSIEMSLEIKVIVQRKHPKIWSISSTPWSENQKMTTNPPQIWAIWINYNKNIHQMFRKVLSNKLPINFSWAKINHYMNLSFNFAVVKLTSQVHLNILTTTNLWLIWNLILEKDLILKLKLQTINIKHKNQVLIFRDFKLLKILATIKIIFHLKLVLTIQNGKTMNTTIVLVQK